MYLQSGRDELKARNCHVHQCILGRNAPWCALFAQGSHTDFRWGFIRDRDGQKCEMKHNYASSELNFSVRKAVLRPVGLDL